MLKHQSSPTRHGRGAKRYWQQVTPITYNDEFVLDTRRIDSKLLLKSGEEKGKQALRASKKIQELIQSATSSAITKGEEQVYDTLNETIKHKNTSNQQLREESQPTSHGQKDQDKEADGGMNSQEASMRSQFGKTVYLRSGQLQALDSCMRPGSIRMVTKAKERAINEATHTNRASRSSSCERDGSSVRLDSLGR